jgi:nucleoid-associated protein YgaU
VALELTAAKDCKIVLDLAGKNDQVAILSGGDNAVITVYGDRVELKDKATVYVTNTEKATVTATGPKTTVDVVQTPCDMTINTADGEDTIRVGVVYETAQSGVKGYATNAGWLSAGAVHKLTLNTGSGNDRVDIHSVEGEVVFSGGDGDDLLYIHEYRYAGGYEHHAIGKYGAYEDVETVILNRLVDRYTVVKYDTLTKIAKQFGVTVEDLVKWNSEEILDPDWIEIGQVLIVSPYNTEEEIITERIR